MKPLLFICFFTAIFFEKTAYSQDTLQFEYLINKHRVEKAAEFKNPDTSPLTSKQIKEFSNLEYFSTDKNYKVDAIYTRIKNQKSFKMKTSTERLPEYLKYGEITFVLNKKTFILSVYQNLELLNKKGYEDYLFIPFTDDTNGEETYGGGRYIDFKIPENSTIILDFNLCYNPYCAYNHDYSCPIPPKENYLPIKIYAGEKKFEK